MADFYVDPSASGANDGGGDGASHDPTDSDNWTDAWVDLQSAIDNGGLAAGDIIYCRGTQTLASATPIDVDGNVGSLAGGFIRFIGCNPSTGAIDGTRFVIDADNSSVNGLAIAASGGGAFHLFENVEVLQATGDGVGYGNVFGNPIVWINCKSHSNSGHGWENYYKNNDFGITQLFFKCLAQDNGGNGFNNSYSPEEYFFCVAKDNGDKGFESAAAGRSLYYGSQSISNDGNGFGMLSVEAGYTAINCTADGNNDDGFMSSLIAQSPSIIIGSRITDNGFDGTGHGINTSGAHTLYGWCAFDGNDSGDLTGDNIAIPDGADRDTNEHTITVGYEDKGGGDYNLTDSATLRRVAITMPT